MTGVDVRALLAGLDLRPSKGLGQHFLVDEVHLRRIVDAARLLPNDVVLEVGPGPGTLTALLAEQAGCVVAVELDQRLISHLRNLFADQPHVHIVHGDILKLAPEEVVSAACPDMGQYKVVANLPYYITSAVLRHLLEADHPPSLLVLTVQREVAQRIVAKPPHMSLLAVSVQFYAEPHIVARIPAGAFRPIPKVDSAVLRLERRPQPAVDVEDADVFFSVVRAGFAQRRKQLRNSLSVGLRRPAEEIASALAAAGIDPRRRPETLTLKEWEQVYRALASST